MMANPPLILAPSYLAAHIKSRELNRPDAVLLSYSANGTGHRLLGWEPEYIVILEPWDDRTMPGPIFDRVMDMKSRGVPVDRHRS